MRHSPTTEEPVVLHTQRLTLRLADPWNEADCRRIIQLYNDENCGAGGNARVGIKSVRDVQAKHRLHGPKPEFCTLAPPPPGMIFQVYPRNRSWNDTEERNDLMGMIGVSFRPEMPCPDLGYGFFAQCEGHGYASEAGKEALRWWRDEIGVKEIFVGTMQDNVKSQRCAERIGFVKAGTFTIVFGQPPNEQTTTGGAFVLPGMEWKENMVIHPTIGTDRNVTEGENKGDA